jgi:hypothetical protein
VFGSSTKIPFLRKISAFSGRRALRNLVAETRQNWANNYRLLLGQIIVPTILFWFSKRGPDYKEKYTNVGSLFGEFPHLVNCNVLNKVKKYSDYYVECMSRRGSPQLLISRFTGKLTTIDPALDRKDLGGKLWTHNEYYPSPEMHLDAADVLERVCRDVIKATK